MENCTAFSVTQEQRLVSIHPGADHEVGYLTFASRVLLHLGYPSQALEKAQEAVTCARKLSHPLSLVHALGFLIRVHIFRKEYDAIHKYIETILTVSTEHGIAHWLGHRTIYLGWLLSVQGQPAEGVPLMHQGLEATRAFGQELDYQYLLALLSEGYGLSGRLIEGLEVLDEALVLVERYEERYWEAELHRLKGGLLLGLSDDNETEAGVAYQKALSIARFQQAKSLELRAATSLARLWQQQGKRKDAYDQLAPVYKWFTEGFDTPDLQEAKALLVELGV